MTNIVVLLDGGLLQTVLEYTKDLALERKLDDLEFW